MVEQLKNGRTVRTLLASGIASFALFGSGCGNKKNDMPDFAYNPSKDTGNVVGNGITLYNKKTQTRPVDALKVQPTETVEEYLESPNRQRIFKLYFKAAGIETENVDVLGQNCGADITHTSQTANQFKVTSYVGQDYERPDQPFSVTQLHDQDVDALLCVEQALYIQNVTTPFDDRFIAP